MDGPGASRLPPYQTDPVDVGAQSDLFGATAPAVARPPITEQNGGSGAAVVRAFCTLRNRLAVSGTGPGWCGARIWRHAAARASSGRRLRGSGSAAGQRVAVRFTSSAAAVVTAVTTATEGHAPMRLARGCEPPIAATYTAVRLTAVACRMRGTSLARTRRLPRRTARRPGHGGPSAVRRGTPARPRAATADDRDVGVPLMGFTLSAGARRPVPLGPARLLTRCL